MFPETDKSQLFKPGLLIAYCRLKIADCLLLIEILLQINLSGVPLHNANVRPKGFAGYRLDYGETFKVEAGRCAGVLKGWIQVLFVVMRPVWD
jgi:hypothetical protein